MKTKKETTDSPETVEETKSTTTTKPKKTVRKRVAKKATGKTTAAPTPRKKNYINNADLLKELAISREQDKMTDELAKMLFMLVQRYAKHPDYANIHSYKMDMEAFANLTIVKVWKAFNPEKSSNPFAYFTQVIRHAFYQYLNHEKKQRETKDIIRVDMGELPSFSFMENYREERDADYDENYNEMDDDDETHRYRRPGYDATLPGEVTEIDYTTGVFDDSQDEEEVEE